MGLMEDAEQYGFEQGKQYVLEKIKEAISNKENIEKIIKELEEEDE